MELITIHDITQGYKLARQNRDIQPDDLTITNIQSSSGSSFGVCIIVPALVQLGHGEFVNTYLDYPEFVANGPNLARRAAANAYLVLGIDATRRLPVSISDIGSSAAEKILVRAKKVVAERVDQFNNKTNDWLRHIYSHAASHATEQGGLKAAIAVEVALLNAQKAKVKALNDQLHTASVDELTAYMKAQPFAHLLDLSELAKTPRQHDGIFTL